MYTLVRVLVLVRSIISSIMKYKNNPLNLRSKSPNKWKGQLGVVDGFCTFESLDYGVRAAAYTLMQTYRRRRIYTYGDIIKNWFSYDIFHPKNYDVLICNALSVVSHDIPKIRYAFAKLLYVLWQYEQGERPSLTYKDILCKLEYYNLSIYG